MKILIVGAGGVGGYFGGKLHQTGTDITYLLREKRQQLIRVQGLVIETPRGCFTIHPKSVLAHELEPIYDLIILTCKAFDLDDSIKSIAKASSKGVILPFLNGLDHLEILDGQFGKSRVMGGVARIAATITPTGSVKQLNDVHMLTIGARSSDQEKLAKDFLSLCAKAEFDQAYSINIEQIMWDKWVFLATLAGMTTICNSPVGNIVATPYGRELMLAMYKEACDTAQACGFAVSDISKTQDLTKLTQVGSAFTASMLRDIQSGNQCEHEHILKSLCNKGEHHGVKCQLIKLAYTHIVLR